MSEWWGRGSAVSRVARGAPCSDSRTLCKVDVSNHACSKSGGAFGIWRTFLTIRLTPDTRPSAMCLSSGNRFRDRTGWFWDGFGTVSGRLAHGSVPFCPETIPFCPILSRNLYLVAGFATVVVVVNLLPRGTQHGDSTRECLIYRLLYRLLDCLEFEPAPPSIVFHLLIFGPARLGFAPCIECRAGFRCKLPYARHKFSDQSGTMVRTRDFSHVAVLRCMALSPLLCCCGARADGLRQRRSIERNGSRSDALRRRSRTCRCMSMFRTASAGLTQSVCAAMIVVRWCRAWSVRRFRCDGIHVHMDVLCHGRFPVQQICSW